MNKASGQLGLCYHCQLPLDKAARRNANFRCELEGETCYFCCPACMAVAQTIHAGGLSSYYQFQENSDYRPDQNLLTEAFSAFDDPIFQQQFVSQDDRGFASVELLIGGIHCAACIWLLENQLQQLEGLESLNISLTEQKADIQWRADTLTLSTICRAIAAVGYQPEPFNHDHLIELQQKEHRIALRRLGIAGIGMMQAGMFAIALYAGDLQSISEAHRDFMRLVSLLVATVVVFYSAQGFFIGAWQGLKKARAVMDLPVAIAIGLAYAASLRATFEGQGEVYFDSVTMFTFLLLAGRFLDMRARHYNGRLNSQLHSLLPVLCTQISPQGEQASVARFSVKVGDHLLVKTGQVIPADGVIIDGHSDINEAQLTGEFAPQRKSPNDLVIAGTINISNPITIEVQATGKDLQLESIGQLLSQAQQHKPKLAEAADRLAIYFISVVLCVAAGTYFYWHAQAPDRAFWITLSVLVVSCPCALSLATPTALTTAGNRLREFGIFVAAGQLWETLPRITHVVFDKTGTLTKGQLSIIQCITLGNKDNHDCLHLAAQLENNSEHPIAHAFRGIDNQRATHAQVTANQGIEGNVKGDVFRIGTASFAASLYAADTAPQPPKTSTNSSSQWVLLSNKSGPLAWFELEDEIREDALQTVEQLQKQHIAVHLLSGDSSGSAEVLAKQLGIKHCRASASPGDKLDYINALQARGEKVMMLGDGINDLPVLAAANISIAMANAPDVAKTQADAILLSGKLANILSLKDFANRTRTTIHQNLGWALLYNFSIIPMAAQGLIPPYLAAIGMSLSSLLVLFNSLRLQRWTPIPH